MAGGQQFDLIPTIFFRVKNPVASVNDLPPINILKIFKQGNNSDAEQKSQISILVKNAKIKKEELDEHELDEENSKICAAAEKLPSEFQTELLIVLDQYLKGQKLD